MHQASLEATTNLNEARNIDAGEVDVFGAQGPIGDDLFDLGDAHGRGLGNIRAAERMGCQSVRVSLGTASCQLT